MANGFEPPIPYTGAKRLWAKELEAIANKMPKNGKILDAYGGSGLCSHVFKSTRPDLQVFCNDSDNYHAKWLPHRAAVEAWWRRWNDRAPTADNAERAEAALAKQIGAELAAQIAAAHAQTLASASRGHNVEWLKGNAAFVKKYGKSI